jgi:hypothetical protein
MSNSNRIRMALILAAASALTGCTTFVDSKTSADVTLQSSQVLEITKDQYQAAVNPH